ncbi:NAD(P)H-binding protein [Actinoplanes sp. NPDC049596]|uniref:NmrA family NAD(P)-binding protein n=1 Tax=unclassified Actinoplanes TaxID=2626549 RepID=UPI003423004F
MIVVTAPTGQIGGQVLQNLLDAGAPVRVIARDPARLAPGVAERADIVQGSHGDPAVAAAALAGADAVFWLVMADPKAPGVDAAYSGFTQPVLGSLRTAGRVVGISALGRGTPVAGRAGHVTGSLALDDLIAGAGVPYRALTMPSFMDNILRQAGPLAETGILRGPYVPDRPMPSVATRDIAAVAARLLLDDGWTGFEEVPVLGPDDLTWTEMAAVIAGVLGRPVRYEQTPPDVFKANMQRFGSSEPMAQAFLDMALAKNEGLDTVPPGTPRTRTPTAFRQWCLDVLKPAVS